MANVLKVGDEVILDIKRLGINGEGIAFYQKLAVFVKNAIPGEGINVRITEVLEKMAFGEIIEFKHASKARAEAKCPYYGVCGGCQTAHIEYQAMLKYKKEAVVEALTRYTTLNPRSFEIKDTIGAESAYNYRNRSSLRLKKVNGETKVCMLQANSNILVPIDSCNVQSEVINNINTKVCKLIDTLNIPLYNEKENTGLLQYLVVREAFVNKDVQVCLVVNQYDKSLKNLAIEISKIEHVASVYYNVSADARDGEIYGSVTKLLTGKDVIAEQLDKYKYQIKPTTFFQLNPIQTKVMYDVVKKACKLSFKETVLDAYCGVGTIGIYLAKMAKEVVGVEYNKESIEQAKENAALNKVKNITFHQGDSKELLPKMIKDGKQFDIIVVDPPRTGLGEELCKTFVNANVKRMVYVSCNPATLAKDLNTLSKIYQVKYIQPIDMFPNTAHVESIVLLSLKGQK